MKILLVAIVMCMVIACNVTERKESSTSENKETILPFDWKRINECGVEFYIPPNLQEEKIQPYDSCAKEYRSENIRLLLDVLEGATSSNFTKSKQYSNDSRFILEKAVIDGQQAEIIFFFAKGKDGLDYQAVLDIPQKNLTIWTHSKTWDDKDNTIKIFKSVRFLKEQ